MAPAKKPKSSLQLAQESAAIGKPLMVAEWKKLTNFLTSSEATLSLLDGPDLQADDQPAFSHVMNETLNDMSAITEDEYKLVTQTEAEAMDDQADKKRKKEESHEATRQDDEDDEDTEMEDDETSKYQTQLPLPLCYNCTQYDITIEVAQSDNPVQAVAAKFMEVYQALLTVDSSTIIYPWLMADVEHVGYYLQSLDQLGKTITEIEPYLNGFNNVTNFMNTKKHLSVFLGHQRSYQDNLKNVGPWLKQLQAGWFYQELQVEKAIKIGWFQYSYRGMNQKALEAAIMQEIGIPVGISWHMISVQNTILPEKQKFVALHIQVPREAADWAKKGLYMIYNPKYEGSFPHGYRMHLVPLSKDVWNISSKQKWDQCRATQAHFKAGVKIIQNWDILMLDMPSKYTGQCSLHDLIMDMTVLGQPTKKLFLLVEKHYSGDGISFYCLPQHMSEAYTRIGCLLLHLLHT